MWTRWRLDLEFFAGDILPRRVFRRSGPRQTLRAATRSLIVTVHDEPGFQLDGLMSARTWEFKSYEGIM